MPLYQQTILTLPKASSSNLVTLFRKYAKTILENGGVVRGIENHGVRPLQQRTRRKFASPDGERYFWQARYVTTTFDASPKCVSEANRMLRNEEAVLRSYISKMKTGIDRSRAVNYKNPYRNLDNDSKLPYSN